MSEENSETTVGENAGSIYLTTASAEQLTSEIKHRLDELDRAYETVQELRNAEADLLHKRVAELERENRLLTEENEELREAMRLEVQRIAGTEQPSQP